MRQWAKHWFSSGRHRVLPVGQNGHRPTAGDPCPNCGAPGPQPFLREHVNLSPLSVTRFRVVRLRIDFCRACGSLVLGSARAGRGNSDGVDAGEGGGVMGERTSIAWCDGTFNPWWGCNEVSEACVGCYAASQDRRLGGGHWGIPKDTPRRLFGSAHWEEPLRWNRVAERADVRRRIFCASMADVFEVHPQVGPERAKLWALIEATPAINWMLLTKRPEQITRMIPPAWLESPRPNVWLGTSVETQRWADLRIPRLLAVPAIVHFLSVEPLLEPVTIRRYLTPRRPGDLHRIDGVVIGGRSGPKWRIEPMDMAWARSLRDECVEFEAAVFFKQDADLRPSQRPWIVEEDGRRVQWFQWPDELRAPIELDP